MLWILAVVVCLLAGAVVVVVWPAEDAPGTVPYSATVGADGVSLEAEGVTVRGPAGVAPAGTKLTLSKAATPAQDTTGLAVPSGPGATLHLDGRQPAAPLTVSLPVTGEQPPESAPVVLTRPSGATSTTLLPATHDLQRRTITAQVSHLSDFWAAFAPFNRMVDTVGKFATDSLGITSPRPDCTGAPAKASDGTTVDLGGGDYSAGATPVVWPCVRIEGQTAVVTLTANTPLPWRVSPHPDAKLDPPGTLEVSKAIVLSAYRTLVTKHPYRDGLLVPSGSVTYRFPLSALPGKITGEVDPITHLGLTLVFGIDMLLKAFGLDTQGLADKAEVIGCVGAAAEAASTGTQPVESIVKMIRSAFSCVGVVTKALGGELGVRAELVLALLGGAVGLLAGALQGIVATVLNIDKFTVTVDRSAPATKVVNVVAARSGKPAAGFTVDGGSNVIDGCEPARAGTHPDIVSCGSTAQGADVCWLAPDRTGLLCASDPWHKTLRSFTVAAPVVRQTRAGAGEPWALVLADGSRCRLRNGGSWPGRADDYRGAYSCTGATEFVLTKYGAQHVDRSRPAWTVLVGDLGTDQQRFPPPKKMAVTTAYFAAP
ncbi:hypothetical protein N8J89_16330 [Crossiella sp. CA-258035]|uniref:hypothetical protein n=1 Tax=Crossiella sp. CA-258035 TaxID=2981138 RepID=UPI0024BC317D|nr:hypothetical protein [Crossiella sp. CA-258035]WHT22566.1 hypothetical protein N8J89_16330 [Crossiella sp. CA-258035]